MLEMNVAWEFSGVSECRGGAPDRHLVREYLRKKGHPWKWRWVSGRLEQDVGFGGLEAGVAVEGGDLGVVGD